MYLDKTCLSFIIPCISLGPPCFIVKHSLCWGEMSTVAATGGLGGLVPPNPKNSKKLSKKNGIKLVRYTFTLKNYAKIPSTSFGFLAGATTEWVTLGGNGEGEKCG